MNRWARRAKFGSPRFEPSGEAASSLKRTALQSEGQARRRRAQQSFRARHIEKKPRHSTGLFRIRKAQFEPPIFNSIVPPEQFSPKAKEVPGDTSVLEPSGEAASSLKRAELQSEGQAAIGHAAILPGGVGWRVSGFSITAIGHVGRHRFGSVPVPAWSSRCHWLRGCF